MRLFFNLYYFVVKIHLFIFFFASSAQATKNNSSETRESEREKMKWKKNRSSPCVIHNRNFKSFNSCDSFSLFIISYRALNLMLVISLAGWLARDNQYDSLTAIKSCIRLATHPPRFSIALLSSSAFNSKECLV